MVTVSIIIPIYKKELYVERCVRSAIAQSYPYIEIVLVDDATPDSSMHIAQRVVQEKQATEGYSFKICQHEQNRGLSAARNTGIRAAKGSYLLFLDADDELLPTAVEVLLTIALEYSADVVQGAWIEKGMKSNQPFTQWFAPRTLCCSQAITRQYAQGTLPMQAWCKLVNTKIVRGKGLWFCEGLLHEDVPWTFLLCNSINVWITTSQPVMVRHHTLGSIMQTPGLHHLQAYAEGVRLMHRYIRTARVPRWRSNEAVCMKYAYKVLYMVSITPSLPILQRWKYTLRMLACVPVCRFMSKVWHHNKGLLRHLMTLLVKV